MSCGGSVFVTTAQDFSVSFPERRSLHTERNALSSRLPARERMKVRVLAQHATFAGDSRFCSLRALFSIPRRQTFTTMPLIESPQRNARDVAARTDRRGTNPVATCRERGPKETPSESEAIGASREERRQASYGIVLARPAPLRRKALIRDCHPSTECRVLY